MTVKEIVSKMPLSETYELSADKRYLIVVAENAVGVRDIMTLIRALEADGIKTMVLATTPQGVDSLKIFDLEVQDRP